MTTKRVVYTVALVVVVKRMLCNVTHEPMVNKISVGDDVVDPYACM